MRMYLGVAAIDANELNPPPVDLHRQHHDEVGEACTIIEPLDVQDSKLKQIELTSHSLGWLTNRNVRCWLGRGHVSEPPILSRPPFRLRHDR